MSFKNYKREYLMKDIISGIIVALISIPISMGYSQVAGLPVVYGLYGSLFPVIVFGLISSSPQFVFGVDAAPAALVGGTIATLGIASGSEEAMRVVPVITFVTAFWLLLFFLVRAGKLVNYISKPVLGGFISGIGCTIILMQVAKLFGGTAGTGEVFELVSHIISQLGSFNLLSLIMGVGTVAVVLISKKISKKNQGFPLFIHTETLPPVSVFSSAMPPPCFSLSSRQTYSPMPKCSDAVFSPRTKGSVPFRNILGEKPGPSS